MKWFVFLSVIVCLSNNNLQAQNFLKDLGRYDEATIKELSATYEVPLIIIANRVYLPASSCLDIRKIGGDTENRKLGGDTENRKLGGDVENRRLGGDTENRKLGGDIEDRKLGGNTENRKLGGDTENRKLGGDTESRKLGGDVEDRKIGGDIENRKLDGDTENRKIGGDTAEISCLKLKDKTGFILKNVNPNAEVYYYYRGKKIEAESMIITY